jgi:hypothetical protein
MKFSFVRALVFSLISLPLGFILTALGLAVTQSPIEASAIFPWALAIAVLAGCAGGFWRSSPQAPNDPSQPSPDKR